MQKAGNNSTKEFYITPLHVFYNYRKIRVCNGPKHNPTLHIFNCGKVW